jgi:predicted ATPase/DNA-binding winged helix-turn-helix (wHTH) protein
MEAGKPIRLGSRALDILIALVRHAGETASKDELMALVWPDTVVEENTLRVHLTALRRVLGDGQAGRRFVANIPGRGYRFVAPVTSANELKPSEKARAAHNLPSQLTRLIGRDAAISELVYRLPRRRLLTITGAGGIGKTGVALAVADRLIGKYEHGVWLIDLGPLADARLVPSAICSALSLSMRADDPVAGLVEALNGRQILLLLDCCEHIIAGVAEVAEALCRGVPGAHILVTSREPLRAEGEWIYRLPPLEVPPVAAILGVADALAFGAIQLFAERAAASSETFELKDADVPLIADICRRLDGIPLAIELAAARVDFLGIRGLTSLLDDRFRLLMQGRRTALPRHQSLRATLDWSHSLLAEAERVILRQLSAFRGYFTLEAACAVVAHSTIGTPDVLNGVIGLAEKSLIIADTSTDTIQFRLLDTARSYALEKLMESGEFAEAARRHAIYFHALLEKAEPEFGTRSKVEWLATYGSQIDNVRAAIDWAFSAGGNAAIGVSLTVAAVPLWMNLSLIGECRDRVNQALSAPETARDERRDMQLHAALGGALLYTVGPGTEVNAAWAKALEIADSLQENDCRFRALWGLWVSRINNSDHKIALGLAQKFLADATKVNSPIDAIIGDRMVGFSSHFLGNQADARQHIERMVSRYVPHLHRSHILRYQYDQWATALGTLAARC